MGTIQIDGSTPKLTIGNATAEDATILFDGNAQDFYIALDDSADDLLIGLGSTVGTTPIIAIDENKLSTFSGAITVGVDDTGHDVKLFGATAGSFLLWDESADALLLTDSTPIQIGDAQDLTLYHDGSHSYITNKTGTMKLATETSGIAVTIGHTTSEVTIADNLTVTGTVTLADGSLALADLDIDGGTDIGADIVDADLFIIDDGAGGTNRKTAASRIKTYAGHTFAGCRLYKTSEQTNITANSDVVVTFEAEEYDTDTFHDTSSNTSRITIPSAFNGMKARFSCFVTFTSVSDAGQYEVRLAKNGALNTLGSQLFGAHRTGSATGTKTAGGTSHPVILATNDYFEVIVAVNEDDVDLAVSSNGSATTYFTGFSMEICPGS